MGWLDNSKAVSRAASLDKQAGRHAGIQPVHVHATRAEVEKKQEFLEFLQNLKTC